jgi:hypothetical protein
VSFDWNAELRETAEHLAWLYAVPGFKWQALEHLNELDRDPVWGGLLDLVPADMAAELPKYRA